MSVYEARERVEGEPHDRRVVIRRLVCELRVHVHDVIGERPCLQGRREQDVIERLRVALKHVGVALVQRQPVDQVGEHARPEDRDGVRELDG
jgi:hypothetical protein